MTHAARILADSISPAGVRLTTLEVTFPRIVLAEFNTHRVFSRNSASSRAIPVERMLAMVCEHPYVPSEWGQNQKGMQAEQLLDPREASKAEAVWLQALYAAVDQAQRLLDCGVHKQLTNRLLEPFLWHTVIVSSTEWSNFFHLRCHAAAHPDIRKVAVLMRDAMVASAPRLLAQDEWHLPLTTPDELQEWRSENIVKMSVGRCARVSYLTHDGKRNPEADIALHDRLLEAGHMSPFEHVARPMTSEEEERMRFMSNFDGWVQYRKLIVGEADILGGRR
jgi:thymidylate synthase ThyX